MNILSAEGSASLSEEQELIEAILPHAQFSACSRGSVLLSMGESSESFYYVEKGKLEVSYTVQETDIVVALIGPGTFFGEIGFFDRLTRTRNIRAVEDVSLRVFDRKTMDRIRSEDPVLYGSFLEYMLQSVCKRFRQILSDRGPLGSYAAALSAGREQFKGVQPLPADLLGSSDWQLIHTELEDFKARMFDLGYRLQKEPGPDISAEHLDEGERSLNAFFEMIRQSAPLIEEKESGDLLWGYVFKEVFPYMMRSRFFERAYYKPKGYAGDFYMIEMIYRNQPEGDGKLGRLIDGLLLNQVPAKAVRGRRRLLHKTLDRICRERLPIAAPIQIMNLACGPCRELFDLIAECGFSDRIQATCVDIDDEALQFADRNVNTFDHRASVRFMNENVIKWALGRVKQDFGPQDVIYSSGLCDYLDKRLVSALIKRSHEHLRPGGSLIIGNFSPANQDRPIMDHLLYWRLIYRDQETLRDLFAGSPFGRQVDIIAEDEGVNLFAVARRSAP
jgi:extracellular factor (EF) 3-hydroxypalmitic acid methyl ester biosynthesis protein